MSRGSGVRGQPEYSFTVRLRDELNPCPLASHLTNLFLIWLEKCSSFIRTYNLYGLNFDLLCPGLSTFMAKIESSFLRTYNLLG